MSSSRVNPLETATVNGMVQGVRTPANVGASPWQLINSSNTRVAVLVGGGTVSLIELSIDFVDFDPLGALGGQFILDPGDILRITYAVAPSVVYYPF